MLSSDNSEFIKLILVGDSSVGKTSLISRFVEDTFKLDQPNTISVDFFAKKMNVYNKLYTVQIWDTAGQERFKSMIRNYFKSASAVLIVFDLTKKLSFSHVDEWLRDVQEDIKKDTPIILIGNKCDLPEQRQITSKSAAVFAKKRNMDYFETSAVSSVGIKQVFEAAAQKVVETRVDQEQESKDKLTNLPKDVHLSSTDKPESRRSAGNCCI